MNTISYTFRVIRYVHDPAVGEMLNVGVLLHAPTAEYLGFKFEPSYGRLSTTFVNFDGENFRRYVGRMEAALKRVAESVQPGLGLYQPPQNMDTVTNLVFPDTGGSFQLGPVLGGITDDPAVELEILFDRMVASQYRREPKVRRDDDQVWKVYQRRLPIEVRQNLKEKTFETKGFVKTFPRTFKNGKQHILEVVSMDYADAGTIQEKALGELGKGAALEGHPDLAKMYLLLGAPQNEAYRPKYNQAKDLLHKLSIPHQIIEEDEAEHFADYLTGYMREHGLLPEAEKVTIE